jgi:hypothetical protein
MRKIKKFAAGGSTDRAERMRERRMADIEKDFQKALAKGKSEKEARAKRDQRIADAKDDYAKRTGADRTETRAAEKAAEAKLTATRRGVDKDIKPVSITSGESKSLAAKMDMPKVETPDLSPKAEIKRRAPAAAPAPIKKRAAAPTPPKKEAPKYGASFGAPQVEKKPENKSVGRQMAERSSRRQQSQIDELGRDFGKVKNAVSWFLAGKNRDKMAKGGKVKKYAKGGKIDGCAVRGKTRAARKK